ncbi:MAG: endo-1,4-beta-xylanase [Bacteroidales bacterium]
MHKNRFLFLVILALTLFRPLTAQVPDGGIRLNAETGTTFQEIGNCTATAIAVTGQEFTEGIRIAVGSTISNTWDAQVKFPAIAGIETGDVLLVAFYARTISSPVETGEGNVNVIVENNTTYAKEISYNITIGNEWKQYYASAVSGNTLATSGISYLFHCGFPDQVIEVADVQYLNYKQTISVDDLPFTEVSYYGRDPDAAWRTPAADRINQLRKGQADITVYDATGQPLEGATVALEMVQHQFGFGTAIAAGEFNNNSTYRNKVLEMFNEVVFENDLKWPQFNPSNTDHITRAMDTLDAHHIPIRGHNVIWPSWKFTPNYLESLKDDPLTLRNTIDNHIDQVTSYTKGRLNDWDVINEPYSEHDIQDILGNEAMADWFKRTKLNDRDVKLYLNEYSIISSGGKNTVKQDYYYNLIQEIEGYGGEIDGIGIQGHMSSELTPITRVYDILEKYAPLGKEIKITEHDIALDQRDVQADYTRDFMTITFSHASVKSLMVWGFWEGRHWKPDAAFFNQDWTIRPHGEVWNDMIYNQWWTPDTSIVSNTEGALSLEGFLGTYKYTVTHGETVRTGTFTIDHSFQSGNVNTVIISLDEALPEEVKITSSVPGFICAGETAVLSAPAGDGLNYTWYLDAVELPGQTGELAATEPGSYTVTVSKNGVTITSEPYLLEARPAPTATITPAGDVQLCDGEIVTLNSNTGESLEYVWKKNGVQFLTETTSIDVNTTGTYSVVTILNGCMATSDGVNISVTPKPEATINVSGDLTLCEGESVYLLGTVATNLTYVWFRDGVETGETNRLLETFESGSYTVQTTLGNCSTLSEAVDVVVNPVPNAEITVGGDLTFCEGSDLTLTGNEGEGLIYSWFNGNTMMDETSGTLVVTEEGSYTLTTTLANCTATSDPVMVSVLAATDPACANSIFENQISAAVYPNPFKKSFVLDTRSAQPEEALLKIYNALGDIIFMNEIQMGAGNSYITVPQPGFYLMKISTGNSEQSIRLIAE